MRASSSSRKKTDHYGLYMRLSTIKLHDGKIPIKYRYPLPLISEIVDKLQSASLETIPFWVIDRGTLNDGENDGHLIFVPSFFGIPRSNLIYHQKLERMETRLSKCKFDVRWGSRRINLFGNPPFPRETRGFPNNFRGNLGCQQFDYRKHGRPYRMCQGLGRIITRSR